MKEKDFQNINQSSLKLALAIFWFINLFLATFFPQFSLIPKSEAQFPLATHSANLNDQEQKEFLVTKVIDGDTIVLEDGQKVRYIGIDAPEKNNDCYSLTAWKRNEELVWQKKVVLEKDRSETDRYGRLLRYVYLGEKMINEILVQEGYAWAKAYKPDIKYQQKFQQAQARAQEKGLGLWSENCQE